MAWGPNELWKLQLPIAGETAHVMMYNESRRNTILLPIDTPGLVDLFGGEQKIYAWGKYDEEANKFEFDRSLPIIDHPVFWPEW